MNNETQHDDIQNNDTQRNDTQHNDTQHNATQPNDIQQMTQSAVLGVTNNYILLIVVMLYVVALFYGLSGFRVCLRVIG